MTAQPETLAATTAVENPLITAIRGAADRDGSLHCLGRDDGQWRQRSWSDVLVTAEAVAAGLQSRQHRDDPQPVAVIGDPTFEMIAILLGTWMAGRASTILAGPNRHITQDAWSQQTADRLGLLGVGEVFSQGTPLKALESHFDGTAGPAISAIDSVTHWPKAPGTFATTTRLLGAPTIYQSTAGSTGISKTVALTAPAVLNQIQAVLNRRQYIHDEHNSLCSWLPLYHDLGLTMLLYGMVAGAPTWMVPTQAFAKAPMDWIGWLDHSRATVTAAPNFAYAALGKYAGLIKAADLSNLRVAINGAEPIDVDATTQFVTNLGKFGFPSGALCCSYGLAEATCGVTMPHAASGMTADELVVNGALHKAARLGPAMDGVEIRFVPSDHRTDLDDLREVGEIEFRSTSQMIGYVGDAPLGADDWIRTGDLGYLVDGELVVCGRSKELITIAGRNIFPQEVERVAGAVAGIRPGGVAVVGGKGNQARRDRLVVVAEYLGDNAEGARQEIIERVSAECGVVPSLVDFVDILPKTTSGKLRRVEIAAQYQ